MLQYSIVVRDNEDAVFFLRRAWGLELRGSAHG